MRERKDILDTNTAIIYVPLLNEGTVTYRPTTGCHIQDDIYRLLPTDNYNPEDETWEFEPGTYVRCELKQISTGNVLVAVETNN